MNFKKNIVALFICLIGQFQFAQEQPKYNLFIRGNELFEQGLYQDAFDVYHKIEHKGFAVWYNMSLCSLRLHNTTQKILCSKQAEKQATCYKELTLVQEVLDFNEALQDEPISEKGWYEQIVLFCKKCILIIPILVIQLLVIIGLMLLILGWYTQWYKKRKRLFILFLIIWFALYAISLYKIDFIEKVYGVVIQEQTALLAGPDASFYRKAEMKELALVTIIDKHDRYYKIKLDKLVGWVDSQSLELI